MLAQFELCETGDGDDDFKKKNCLLDSVIREYCICTKASIRGKFPVADLNRGPASLDLLF